MIATRGREALAEDLGLAVDHVATIAAGRERLAAHPFDVVVLEDLALFDELRSAGNGACVVVRTADSASALRALELGAADFVPHTDDDKALHLRVRAALVRRTAEEEARSLALFPQLNPTAVLRLGADGRILYANPATIALAGALGIEVEQLLPADIRAIAREARVLETHHGSHTLAWTFHPVPAMDVVHCYAVDITDRLLLEEQLRQSQKMDAIGHLAGGIAHDFNNLLTVIYANTMMLQRTQPSEGLSSIVIASERAALLVRQLLAFSRQQVLQTRDIELNVTVVNLLKLLERVVPATISLELDLADHPVWARADASMLDQVVMNLVVNARDAMPNGGKLLIATSVLVLDEEDRRAMPDLSPGAYARLRVTDSGIGIAPENLSKIFDPFFTTKDLGKGTGL
ncbi:MAG: ATP-binding protein, partial [Polyangiales bacterium]